MFKPKLKHVFLVMCIAVVAFGVVAMAQAYVRPYNPTMDYVPQNVGIYDTYYCNFKESDCRACHGTTTAWRHHATELAVRGQCLTCHDPSFNPFTNPERDCKVCHIDFGPLGNLGNPHHRSQYADADLCTACHASTVISQTNTIEPPQFDPTNITPTPFACENCHWSSGAAAHQAPPFADWNLWVGFPKPTTWPDSLPHPAPIEANGPVLTGTMNPGKAYRPLDGTHHEIAGAVYPKCYNCHGTNPDTDPSWDPTDPYLIRMCENCHDIYTIHDSAGEGIEHTTIGIGGSGLGGYTVGGVLDQIVLGNMKCVACHGDVVSKPMPTDPGPGQLVIGYLEPPMGSPGVTFAIIDDSGNATFGDQGANDLVQMFDGSAWVAVPIVSWTSNRIEAKVPGWTFVANANYGVRVVKQYWVETLGDNIGDDDSVCDPGEACTLVPRASNNPNFYVRKHPVLTSLVPDSGTWGTTVSINGVTGSFYSFREQFSLAGVTPGGLPIPSYGYSTYVELVASNDRYRVTEMTGSGWNGDNPLGAWSDTLIKIRLQARTHPNPAIGIIGNLLDVNTGNFVPLADLYKGNWQVYVITDYFIDDSDGMYMEHLGGVPTGHLTGKIDAGDILLYREVSDPLPWFATDTPFISSLQPSVVKGGNLSAVYGINFGTTQDTSTIFGQACSGVGTTYALSVYQWSNTRVVFRTPVVGSNKTGCIKVRVPKVLPPGSIDSNFSPPITVTP